MSRHPAPQLAELPFRLAELPFANRRARRDDAHLHGYLVHCPRRIVLSPPLEKVIIII
jgi:hypothetical protein